MRRWYLAMAAVLAVVAVWALAPVTSAQAAPLDAKQIAHDAKWVAHLDVDAMRESVVVKKAYEKATADSKKLADALPKLRAMLGMDPRKDLHGITVYGPKPGKPQGVLIVHADVDQAVLLAKVNTAPQHEVGKHGTFEVHSWTHPHGKSAGAFFKPNVLVFAENPAQVGATLDVLDGKAENLDKAVGERIARDVPQGSILVGWVAGLADIQLPHKSPLITQSDALGLAVGEQQGTSFLKAALMTKTPEMAGQVQKMLEGLKAAGELHAANDADGQAILKGVSVTASDKTVVIDAKAPAETVWKVLLTHAEKLAKQHAKKHGHQ